MAAPEARDISDALDERRHELWIQDTWGSRKSTYAQWQDTVQTTYDIYNGNWAVVWPDGEASEALPKIANIVQIAADDRARAVAALIPSVLRRPQKAGDKARAAADKLERIVSDWLMRSDIWGYTTQRWALDAMAGGLTACKVWMDTDLPKSQRYPKFKHVPISRVYPDPVFTDGPKLDNCIIAYDESLRNLKQRFPDGDFNFSKDEVAASDKAKVIEFYDGTWVKIIIEPISRPYMAGRSPKGYVMMEERHELGICPVVIGSRPTMTGEYRGEFYGSFGVLNFANRLRTLMLDDAVNKVYPERITYNIENPEQAGPGANLELQTPDARYEYAQQPNQPFSNLQIMRDLMGEAQGAVMLSPGRLGDPNESIISAAGIGAADSMRVEDVRAIQRDILSRMLRCAIYAAAQWDRKYGEATKTIGAGSGRYVEEYTPSKDVPEDCWVEVRYGPTSGLDEINTNVMVQQQWAGGNGIISRRDAMELSPFVEDPQRTEKALLKERLLSALEAGLVTQAANGQFTAQQLAAVMSAVERDDKSLPEAVAEIAPLAPAPLALPTTAPGSQAQGASPEAPGLPGAAAPTNSLPSIDELFGQAV